MSDTQEQDVSVLSFNVDNQMRPIYCVGCKAHIPRAISSACKGLGPTCIAKLNASTAPSPRQIPSPLLAQSQPNYVLMYSASQTKPMNASIKLVLGTTVGIAATAIFVSYIAGYVRAGHAKERYAELVRKLAHEHPNMRFAVLSAPFGAADMGAQLDTLRVDRVTIDRPDRAQVSLTNTREEDIAPQVWVSIWDENGRQLGRSHIVEHIMKDVSPGQSNTTSDFLKGDASSAVIVGVDDDQAGRMAEAAKDAQENAAKEQQLAAIRAEERVRGPMPVASAWDGITPEVNSYLKSALKDYDSLKLVECSPVSTFGVDAWCQRVKYRAKNSFGAYSLEQSIFVLKDHAVVDVQDW